MGGPSPSRGATLLNGSVPHYNVYQCSDGGWISIGSLEPHFFVNLCKAMGREDFIPHQYDASKRDEIAAYFREQFATKTRDEWFEILKQIRHLRRPGLLARRSAARSAQPARATWSSRSITRRSARSSTSASARSCPTRRERSARTAPVAGQHTDDVLASLGFDAASVTALRERGVVG